MLLKFSPLVSALCYPFFYFFLFCRGYGRLRSCTTGTFYSLGKRLRYYLSWEHCSIILPSQVLNATHPVLPFPSLALVAGSQVVSSGDDTPSSRAVRLSTRSRRGRRGSGLSPSSSSPDRAPRADEEQESGDSGSQGNEGSDDSSDSRQSALPAEDPQQRAPHVEEAPSDSGVRWQRRSVTSPTPQHHEQPRLEGSPGTGTPPH